MPRIKIYGANVDPASVGARQVRGNPTTKAASPPIEVKKFCRNGLPVSAQYWNLLNEATNQAALYRNKQVFSHIGGVGLDAEKMWEHFSTSGTRNRWRFAFHTGPYTTRLMAVAVMAPPISSGPTGRSESSYCKLNVYSDTAEATPVSSATFYYGANPTGTSPDDEWRHMRTVFQPIEGLTANTAYYARWDDVDYGRLHGGTVFELPSLTEGRNGYLTQSLTGDSEVLHVYRSGVAAIHKAVWKQSGATVLTWTKEISGSTSQSITSATPTNLINGTSTTYGAEIPGFTLNMSNKARLSQTTGVPIIMKVYGLTSSGGGEGRCYLKDGSGNTIVSVSGGWSTGSYTWQASAVGNIPATEAKYYLMFDSTSGAITHQIRAVSIYEYEA